VLKQPRSADRAVHAGTDHQDSGIVTCHSASPNNRRGDIAAPSLLAIVTTLATTPTLDALKLTSEAAATSPTTI
jgi:hypothetical protein